MPICVYFCTHYVCEHILDNMAMTKYICFHFPLLFWCERVSKLSRSKGKTQETKKSARETERDESTRRRAQRQHTLWSAEKQKMSPTKIKLHIQHALYRQKVLKHKSLCRPSFVMKRCTNPKSMNEQITSVFSCRWSLFSINRKIEWNDVKNSRKKRVQKTPKRITTPNQRQC